MRIATWNLNSLPARLPRLLAWLDGARPDVVCLQELKCAAADLPVRDFARLDYQLAANSTGRWNGVAIASRVGLADVRIGLDDEPGYQPEGTLWPVIESRAIAATCAGLRVWSVYVPNGRALGHPHYGYKLNWLHALAATIRAELPARSPLAVLGDFNVAPTDADVWDAARFRDATHVSVAERAALGELESAGLADVRPRALKHDQPFTYWDYRALAFPHNRGMRIDLVYADSALAASVRDAYVDRNERKGAAPSDHAPVVVDLGGPDDRRLSSRPGQRSAGRPA